MPRRIISQERLWGFSPCVHCKLSYSALLNLCLSCFMNVSSHLYQPPAHIFWMILANFFFNFFWFTYPIESAFLFSCTEVCSWMDCLQSWFMNLPSTFACVLCTGSLWLYSACIGDHLVSEYLTFIAVFQARYFSRTVCFFKIIGWMFALLVHHFSSGHPTLFLFPDPQVPLSLYIQNTFLLYKLWGYVHWQQTKVVCELQWNTFLGT